MKRDFFTYSNLKGEHVSLQEDIRLGTPTAAFGLSDTHKYLIASLTEGSMLYIAPDALTAQRAYAAVSTFSGKRCTLLTAKDDVILYKDALSKDAVFRRISAVYEVLCHAEYIICDPLAAMQLVPSRIPSLNLKVGGDYDFTQILELLISYGYTREYSVDAKGSFAVRGDILDVFPINSENPLRVDFFGDEVERIRYYDGTTGERLNETDCIEIVAATDVFFTEADAQRIKTELSKEIKKCADVKSYERARAICGDINEKLDSGIPFAGASFVMPLLESSRTLFDIIPADTLVILDECKAINDAICGYYREHTERLTELQKGGEALSFSKEQLISDVGFFAGLEKFRRLSLQTFLQSTMFFRPLKTYNFHSTPSPSYMNSLPRLFEDMKNWLAGGYRVVVFTGDAGRTGKLCDSIIQNYLPVYELTDKLEYLRGVTVCSDEIGHGVVLHDAKLAIIGNADVYTKAVTKRIRRKRGDMFVSPEIGDYCVHEKHGVGRITGTRKIETTDGVKEYISIEYKGGDTLYVPVEQMDILSKYVGEENPALSRIGGTDFERVKERVRQSIKKLAFDLKELYAERGKKQGYAFPENAVMMSEFEDAFVYEETPDQLSSIAEIKEDMCSGKVMDRLLCGDVGYGKTEVALRAVYLCVLGGKQAAIMCPSTILSEQHYNTALERFREFGLRVEKLNRFKTPAQQAKTIEALKNGDIDLIVGTHRLLSSDVEFYDLGLLVLDEEQRFGVEHKEKIKHVKKNVDCLTMTATPIPRTLHMSLAGIRDISTINTPPQKRLPVQTYVVEESETLIRDACIREISRGGQVFILYNRVETISAFAGKIAEIVPEANVCYAHGRMDRETLENSVFSFYKGEKNVLVTTTIIENGIDLPNANTIIVIDADRLGISQLYQLRGRVGRSSRLAQAYFTFKPDKILTAEATERLKAIMRFTELGSGFKIAMRDLEIRGAGNVLGAEQHGHMDKVGYELYSKLLKEELTGEKQLAAELDIRTTAYIPESFIESSAGRLDCYKQIAEVRSEDDCKRIYDSIKDNYGNPPECIVNLIFVALMKSYAAKFNVKKIYVDWEQGWLELPSVSSLQHNGLAAALDKFSRKTTLSMSKAPLIVFSPEVNPAKTIRAMTKFLKFAVSFN